MSTLEVPISDNYVQMNRLVTDLSRNTDSINNIEIGVTKLTDIYGNQYVIKGFEQNTVTGFFGAILQNTSSLETTAVVAGSYGLMNFTHPAWYPDWVGNNAVVGFDGIPPQFYDTVGLLNNYRHLGIDSATGFSLGAIDLGLALSLTDNYGIQGYFYNGGPPLGLLDNLANSGFSLNLSRDNYATFLSLNEPLGSLRYFAGNVYYSTRPSLDSRIKNSHDVLNHSGLGFEDYEHREPNQGILSQTAETLDLNLTQTPDRRPKFRAI